MFDKTIRGRNLGQVCSPHFASIWIPALGFGHRTNSKVRLIVMTDTASLEGKNIIVTSAAGGLGRAMTEALAGAGAHVVTMFSSGQGVAKDKDPKEAVRWYSKVADHGNTKPRVMIESGVWHLNQAATRSVCVTSIPSLNFTPVITLVK
jgi:TPR repeat protein